MRMEEWDPRRVVPGDPARFGMPYLMLGGSEALTPVLCFSATRVSAIVRRSSGSELATIGVAHER